MFFPQVLKDNIDLHIASTVSIEQPIDSPSIHSIDLITSTEPNSSIESNSFIEPTPISSITTNTRKKRKKRCTFAHVQKTERLPLPVIIVNLTFVLSTQTNTLSVTVVKMNTARILGYINIHHFVISYFMYP